jgi:eukaryotic-like serine/threonine-protein kinase
VVCQVAQGLHALHTAVSEQGQPLTIIHRDLSPHNVMLDRDGRAVLIDLGLAKAMDREALTQTGVLAGKLPYMSPEQARFEPLDARSDVFSLGTVLFELCTGQMPFGDGHTAQTLLRVQSCDPEPLESVLLGQAIPKWVAEIILVCLRARPEDRFQTAADLADAILQEMQRHGHDVPTERRRLAGLVTDAMPIVGRVESATSLPIRIAPIAADAPALGGAFAARWIAVGAIAVGAVLAGLIGFGHSSHGPPLSSMDAPFERTLASDRAAYPDTQPPRATTSPRPPSTSRPEGSDVTETGATAAPPADATPVGPLPPDAPLPGPRRRSREQPEPRPPELKPNPYAAAP